MLTKAKRISSKIFAALCAATLLLGIFVLSTSAQEPTESALAETNPFTYGYEPITEPYIRRIPVTISLYDSMIVSVPCTEFIGDEQDNYFHNLAWLTVVFEGQDDNGDLEVYTVSTPFADCFYLAYSDGYIIQDEYERSVLKFDRDGAVNFTIAYEKYGLPFPDSIIEAYVYIGVNPLRYGYDSNTSGGNTDEAYQNGYTVGYENGYSNGYDEGYSNGYDTASSQIENSNYIKDLGEGIFHGLLDTFSVIEDFEVFGTRLGDIIGYIITALMVLLLVKVVAFVV